MIRQFVRYNLVQVAAYGLDFGGFVLLTHAFSVSPVPANASGKIVAGIVAFLLHKIYTFGQLSWSQAHREMLVYALLLGLNVPLSSAALLALMFVMPSAWPEAAKIVADTLCVGMTFFITRHFVFRPAPLWPRKKKAV